MSERDILHRVHTDPETNRGDILVALIVAQRGNATKHDVAQLGKMSPQCAHRHLSNMADRGYFDRVPRTAANGGHMPTIYRLQPDVGPDGAVRRWVSGLLGYAGNARAGLVRVFLLALAIAMGLGSGGAYVPPQEPGGVNRYGLVVAERGASSEGETGGPSEKVSAAPVTHSFTVTSGNSSSYTSCCSSYSDYAGFLTGPNSTGSISPTTFTYEGTTYTVKGAYIATLKFHNGSAYVTSSTKYGIEVRPSLQGRWIGGSLVGTSTNSWDCATAMIACRTSSGSSPGTITSAGIRLHPPWVLGTATGSFVTTDPSNITLRVSVPVTDAGPRIPAATTWTISPTPEGITSPENVTVTGSSSASPTVSRNFAGLSPNTTYTVTVKKQGAADSTAKSVQAIYSPPDSITLGAMTGVFSGAGPFRHTLVVTLPASVPDDASATQVPLTWTIHPTPPGASSPEHAIESIDSSGNVVKTFSEMSPLTPYTITVKQYGASESDAKSLAAVKIPDHIPYPAPAIAKVQDQTPGYADTASLLITWDQAPAVPVTGYMLRYNEGTPLEPVTGQERNIVRQLPPIPRTMGKVDIQALAYYSEGEEVTYRGRDDTVPTGEHWFTDWSEPYTINISRPSEAGEYVPPKEAAPLVVETFEQLLPVMGIPAEHAANYALLFLFFLTVGAGGFLYVTTGGGAMSAALGGMAAVIIWSGLGWWWFGLPVPMALVPVVIIILAGGTIVTSRVLA